MLPAGVMPRYLYSIFAIVMAMLLVAPRPLGDGLDAAEAYDRQGMNRIRGWNKPWPYRWRSLDRWASHLAEWWPGLPDHIDGVVAGWRRRAGRGDVHAVLAASVKSHVRWGLAM